MRRAGPDFCWLGLGILVVLLFLAVSGPIMRECDQAALLEGAVDIARTGEVRDHGWYNYDKQFLSYWFLAGVIDLAGLEAPGADPRDVVALGNRTAAVFFSVALLVTFGFAPRRSMAFLPVLLGILLTPALIFSVPLLSSNIFSGGCLLLLAAALRRRHAGWTNAILCAVLAAAAVGFRRDAALVLPLLCLLSTTRFSVGGLFRERRHWLMAAAAVAIVVLGHRLTTWGLYVPDMFFDVRLFGAYVVFGLAGATALLFWLPFRLATSRRRWFLRAATGLAMLLPFAFYTPYLYSPRHFFLSVVVLLTILVLPRGELWWQVLRRRRLDRFVVHAAVLFSLALWVVGLRFETATRPAVVTGKATLYPTADGFWPMGCNREFLIRLSRSVEEPLDHNQEMWEAWTRLEGKELPDGRARVHSSGLRPYGYLVLKTLGRDYVKGTEPGDYDLVPDRSIARVRPGFHREDGEERREIDWESSWFNPLGGNEWRRIYLVEEPGGRVPSLALRWVAQLVIVKALGPDDFHLRAAGAHHDWFGPASRGLRFALVFGTAPEAEAFRNGLKEAGWEADLHPVEAAGVVAHVVSFVSHGDLPREVGRSDLSARWVSRSLLPAFMSRSNY